MTDSLPPDSPAATDLPDRITDPHGDLEADPDPLTEAEARDEQQIVDLQGGDAAGGDPD